MSSNSTRIYDWQRLASPAPTCSSGSEPSSHHSAHVDPFRGLYPNAPHLRPIELPEASPMQSFISPGYNFGSASSRSRPVSLPPPAGTGLGIYQDGMPSPPASPLSIRSGAVASAPTVHPLLRGTATLSAPLLYNPLHVVTTHGTYALRGANGARISSSDLAQPATHPPCSSLRVSLILYPGGAARAPRRFLWDIALTPCRRSSAPPTGPGPVTLGDALTSLHLFLLVDVGDAELRQFSAHEMQSAIAASSARHAAFPNSPPRLVRADFLLGCTEFAGFVRNADNSFVIRMALPSYS